MSDFEKFNYVCDGQLSFEDIEKNKVEETIMDTMTTNMMEHICDNLCKYPCSTASEEELEEICAGCKMGQFICGILNEYNRLNNFEQSQCYKLLQEISTLKEQLAQGGGETTDFPEVLP